MPQAPLLPPDQMGAQAQATGGISPAQFLIAAADLHGQGALPSQNDSQTGPARIGQKNMRANKRLKVVK